MLCPLVDWSDGGSTAVMCDGKGNGEPGSMVNSVVVIAHSATACADREGEEEGDPRVRGTQGSGNKGV